VLLRRRRLREERQLALEVGGIVEALVHAGEADVRHVIDLSQPVEHEQADLLRRHLACADQLLFHAGGDRFEGVIGQRT